MKHVSWEEFNSLPHDKQREVLEEMKKTIGINGILEAWNLTRSKYYYMMKKLNLNEDTGDKPTEPKMEKKHKRSSAKHKEQHTTEGKSRTSRAEDKTEKVAFSLSVEGSQKTVSKVLESVADMYITPEASYIVNVSVQQV